MTQSIRTVNRLLLLGSALSLSMCLSPLIAGSAAAQSAEEPTEVVVTGSRVKRSKLDTLAPVDVIKTESLQNMGSTELAEGLSKLTPSITFPRPSITDGTDSVRPATLRGLAPDQTLVLVNGKRRHASALLNINGSVGRGSTAVDLNTIPESALDRVEVLRDGASAQYGSDAIAGVINLMLRKAASGGGASLSYGRYNTTIEAARSTYDKKDGETVSTSGWVGMPLLGDGYLTLSGEIRQRDATSRGDIDTRTVQANYVTSRYGDPKERAVTVFANAGKPLNDDWETYGWLSFQNRRNQSAANFRQYNNSGNVLAIYPNGFLPKIAAHTTDYSAAGGLKGLIGAWDSDFSLTWGENQLEYATVDTINAAIGVTSPTSFYSGSMTYGQYVADASFSRTYDLGMAEPLNVAFGLEARQEYFKIGAGEYGSYYSSGAQGFPGFAPSSVVDKDRNNVGVYLDVEGKPIAKLTLGAAARYEDYSDFGDNTSGKISARYDFIPAFAVRATASTGFRAPSLQQQYFTAISTNFISGVATQVGTFPADSDVARVLGSKALTAEESTNYTVGFVFHKGPWEATLDGYKIEITDRIVLTENIGGAGTNVAQLLASNGIAASNARFFMNGVDTTTTGVDLVVRYRLPTASLGTFDFSLAANNTNTVIDRFPTTNVLSSLSPSPVLFAHVREYLMTNGTPENKDTFAIDWKKDRWSVSAAAIYYGSVIVAQTNASLDYKTGDHTLVNLSASYNFPTGTKLTFGVDNLFDEYPNQTPLALIGNGAVSFSPLSPFGFNGRYLYFKVAHSW